MFQMIAFDVAGTTVQDEGLVIRAFENAFSVTVPELWDKKSNEFRQYALDTMGQSKIEVFTAMLGSRELAQAANVEFEDAYLKLVESDGLDEIPGAEALLISLREKGFKTALTTGFSRPTLDAILDSLGWRDLVDTTVVPGDVGVGRPSPLMLEAAASSLGVEDRSSCVVVGDTGSDMQAAVAFGAGTRVGVLSGAHGREFLLQKGATAVLYSVADLPNLLFN